MDRVNSDWVANGDDTFTDAEGIVWQTLNAPSVPEAPESSSAMGASTQIRYKMVRTERGVSVGCGNDFEYEFPKECESVLDLLLTQINAQIPIRVRAESTVREEEGYDSLGRIRSAHANTVPRTDGA